MSEPIEVRRTRVDARASSCGSRGFPSRSRSRPGGRSFATSAAWHALLQGTGRRLLPVLYQVVRDHFETFRAEAAASTNGMACRDSSTRSFEGSCGVDFLLAGSRA